MNASIEDDFERRVRCNDYLRGGMTVHYVFQYSHGRGAEIRISYEGQYSLQFVSMVDWPQGNNFEAAVRKGILIALEERGRHSLGGKFTLLAAPVDLIESCEANFSKAGREAAASIIRLLKPCSDK